ncbi:MAG: hypothetical protein ACO3XN_05750, partial [Chthoniobacterales bacterium]
MTDRILSAFFVLTLAVTMPIQAMESLRGVLDAMGPTPTPAATPAPVAETAPPAPPPSATPSPTPELAEPAALRQP